MIYFAEAVGIGNIKIGFTDGDDAEVRLATLQTGCPVPLRLLGVIPGTVEDEKNLHRRFAAARVHGEWFKPVPDLLALIGAAPRECDGVSVAERSVTIRVLTVGRKQLTAALVKQLPTLKRAVHWDLAYYSFLNPDEDDGFSLDAFRLGDCWGWVSLNDGRYLIIELDGRLYLHWDSLLSDTRLREAFGLNPYQTDADAAFQNSERRKFFEMRKKYPGWRDCDQLFFGV